jgi:tRNA 2-thiocytidine biosynthesis protein TtcA
MRTVQQYYDDNRDKILFDVRALEEYEKETIEASIHYYWEDMIKVLEDNKEEFEAKYSKDTPIYILCYTGQKSEEIEDILDEMGYEAYSLDGGFVAYLRWKFNKYLEQDKESGNNTSEENVKEIERSIVKKFRKPIWRKFTQALNEYDLIQDGDKIAVCISGGKDSMLMAKLFQELKRHGKNNFELVFLVMNPGYNDLNYNVILNNAKILDIPITVFKTEIFDTVVDITESPCYLCARMRRGYLYSKAKELGCNKIALGHHYDDVIETILMGMLYGAQVQTMMPKLHSTNFEGMELIRPMYLIREADIIHWKEYNNLEFIQCACRFTEGCASCGGTGKGSKRAEIKQLIKDLTKVSPYIEKNIFRSVENVNIDTVIAYKKKGQRHSFLDEYDITDDKYAGNAEVDNSENTSKELNKSDINSSGQLSEYHTDETIELDKTGSAQIMSLNKSDINKDDISENTLAKYEKLKSIIKDCGKIAIAFSGGVDSTFLTKVAKDVLGENAVAVTISSILVTDDELKEADDFCKVENIEHLIYKADVLSIPGFEDNPPDRCYICKKAIFTNVKNLVGERGISVIAEGTNVDDDGDYRPGMRAIKELGVRSPLKEAGLTKAEIRELSCMLGLKTWNKPSCACLASRFAYGEVINKDKLDMIYSAECYIRSLGFEQFRVRLQDGIARIELRPADIQKFIENGIKDKVSEKLHALGFKYVSLDLDGYRLGSMNEVLNRQERGNNGGSSL